MDIGSVYFGVVSPLQKGIGKKVGRQLIPGKSYVAESSCRQQNASGVGKPQVSDGGRGSQGGGGGGGG